MSVVKIDFFLVRMTRNTQTHCVSIQVILLC